MPLGQGNVECTARHATPTRQAPTREAAVACRRPATPAPASCSWALEFASHCLCVMECYMYLYILPNKMILTTEGLAHPPFRDSGKTGPVRTFSTSTAVPAWFSSKPQGCVTSPHRADGQCCSWDAARAGLRYAGHILCVTECRARQTAAHQPAHKHAAELCALCVCPDFCCASLTQTLARRLARPDQTKLPSHLRRPRGSPRAQGAMETYLRARQVDNPTDVSVSTGQRSAGGEEVQRGCAPAGMRTSTPQCPSRASPKALSLQLHASSVRRAERFRRAAALERSPRKRGSIDPHSKGCCACGDVYRIFWLSLPQPPEFRKCFNGCIYMLGRGRCHAGRKCTVELRFAYILSR